MKLTDDKKVREENGIVFENSKDIKSVSTELKRDEEESGCKGKITMNMNGVFKKCTRDEVVENGKKVEEEENKNNFNMDMKEQEKNIKSITEDLEKFCINDGAGDMKKVGKLKRDDEKEAPLSLAEIGSVNVELEVNADKSRSVEDIMTRMDKLDLGSGIRTKDKDQAKSCPFDMTAFLQGLSDEQIESNEEHLRTIEIIAQPEKKCEENEDFEETRVLSDACDCRTVETSCSSFVAHGVENEDFEKTRVLRDACGCKREEARCSSFVARGPILGVPRDTEHRDLKEMLRKGGDNDRYSEFSQPRKYGRPSNSEFCKPIMSGGCYQVVQPDQPVHPLYSVRALEEPNMSLLYSDQGPDNFLYPAHSELPAIHPYYNDQLNNYTNGCHGMQHCLPYYDGSQSPRRPVYPPMDDCSGGFDNGAIPAYIDNELVHNFAFGADQGMSGMPCNPQSYYHFNGQMGSPNVPFPSSHSPHDQCLTSPGSSPPSVLSYPLSPTSTILTNGDADLLALSPGNYSLSSPESGFHTDASHDLEDALEFISAEMAASSKEATGNNVPLLPVMLTEPDLNTELVFSSSGIPCQNAVNVSHTSAKPKKQSRQPKNSTRRSQKVAQSASGCEITPRILPPVTFYSPPGLGANQLPATAIQIVFEQPRSNPKPSTRTLVPIQPKKTAEPSAQSATKLAPPTDVSSSALPKFSPPSASHPSPQEPAVTSASDQDQLVKAYRAVAGFPKEQLLGQDDDGDTILHLAIVKDQTKLVKALLERYIREGLMIDKVINLANKQHQTPLCLAVFLNQTEIVKMLIERMADVNVQLQRKLNGGLKCYRLIHYAASRGKKWVPTLIQLLSADNIDLQAFNSEGCTAMHCAIECHGKHYQQGDEKIDSKDTIYHLAMRGADLNVQHGLCGKTPLHYAIEKKDSDLVGWFLGLASYVQSSGPKQSNGAQDLVHSLLNAKTSAGVTALQLALGLQMERTERIPILKMLLRDGAEVSQKGCDGKLRQELAKYPELAGLLKNGSSTTKNVPR